MAVRTFAAIIHKEADLYVAECPEVGTARVKLSKKPSSI